MLQEAWLLFESSTIISLALISLATFSAPPSSPENVTALQYSSGSLMYIETTWNQVNAQDNMSITYEVMVNGIVTRTPHTSEITVVDDEIKNVTVTAINSCEQRSDGESVMPTMAGKSSHALLSSQTLGHVFIQ